MAFSNRAASLPKLGIGISTEFGIGSCPSSVDIQRLHEDWPSYGEFIEIGVSVDLGIDGAVRNWITQGLPSTFHFLDLNLGEPEDFDDEWIHEIQALLFFMKPVWICGDAGQWHFGRREPAHGFLQPPILSKAAMHEIAEGIIALRELTGLEVLPENPPGTAFIGDLHLLDFFGELCMRADTGMVLDCSHLWMYQHAMGYEPFAAFDGFPFERVIEVHVAGGELSQHNGYPFISDSHGPNVLPETWQILREVCQHSTSLKAVALEGERNPLEHLLPTFSRIVDIARPALNS